MKKGHIVFVLVLLSALLLGGCAVRTVDELYSIPKRSKEFQSLQASIDIAMAGLEYSAPISGENQQTLQIADLNGDGTNEYLVFAKGSAEKPLQILIFREDSSGTVQISEIISGSGSTFDMVEYVEIDGKPGCELVVGYRVSDQLLKTVSVYSFAAGRAELLMTTGYSRFLSCDLGSSDQMELLILQRGESDEDNAIATLYRYQAKTMVRTVEVRLSNPIQQVNRLTTGSLPSGIPAVFISSAVDDTLLFTDILALDDGKLVSVPLDAGARNGIPTLNNYFVYPDDADRDGILELPRLIPLKPISNSWTTEDQYLIQWYTVDLDGSMINKCYTFHNFAGGWYLDIPDDIAERLSVYQVGKNYAFFLWDEDFQAASTLYTIYALTGSDRENQSCEDGRFPLHKEESVIYAARIESEGSTITQETLLDNFHLLYREWAN